MTETITQQELCDGDAGSSRTVDDDAAFLFFLSGDTQRVNNGCQNDDGSSVLIIVEYRDVQRGF